MLYVPPPPPPGFAVELTLDGLKAPGGRRALFMGGREPSLSLAVPVPNGAGARCHSMAVFLRVWGGGGLGVLRWGGGPGDGGGSLAVGWVPMEVPMWEMGAPGYGVGVPRDGMGLPGCGVGSYGGP